MAHKHPIVRSKPYLILFVGYFGLASGQLRVAVFPGRHARSSQPNAQAGAATPAPILPSPTPQVPLSTPTSSASPTPLMPWLHHGCSARPHGLASSPPPLHTAPNPSPSTFSLITGTTAGVIQGTVQAGQVLTIRWEQGRLSP